MPHRKSLVGLSTAVFLAVLAMTGLTPVARAQFSYKTLHEFTGQDGKYPWSGLIFDAAGNLYGTTSEGGKTSPICGLGCGTVFRLTPAKDGKWTETVLHSFDYTDGDGAFGGLVSDAAGNLYGMTSYGGVSFSGVVFKLAPNSEGTWSESVLHNFTGGADGGTPEAGLVFDATGNLYGTTGSGGSSNFGVVFKLSPNSTGTWTESILYSFTRGNGSGGIATLVFDRAGNLYGTTSTGGPHGKGSVYKLAPMANGTWKRTVLYGFCALKYCTDGRNPETGVTLDAAGNIYGVTAEGGRHFGVVFKLTPGSDGDWAESVLYTFGDNPGAFPWGTLVFDAAGNLWGTTKNFTASKGFGTVYKLTPNSDGSWAHSIAHAFGDQGPRYPYANLVIDKAGNLYSTTEDCASGCFGAVFKIEPQ